MKSTQEKTQRIICYQEHQVPGYKKTPEKINMKEYRSLVEQAMFYSTKLAPECAFAEVQLASHMQYPGE